MQMASSITAREGEDYQKHFDGKAYATTLFPPIEGLEHSQIIKFRLDTLHKIYSTGNVTGKLLLEIGSGPCIHTVIPAAKWFDKIILSDYSPSNREMQEKWLKRASDAHNWEPYFKYYSTLNGNEDDWKQLEQALRPKMKKVLFCDVHLPNPLEPVRLELADVVCSSACLESASPNIDAYNQAMKNVVSLLKPGGKFILVEFLNAPYYPVGNERFKCLSLTKDQVLKAVKLAGLEVLEIFDDDYSCETDFASFKGSVLILSQKK